jgi:ankyrin
MLSLAAQYGCIEIMTILLDHGTPINAVNSKMHCACDAAIAGEQLPALELLISRGASLETTMLVNAAFCRDKRLVVALLNAGVPLNAASQDFLTNLATHSVGAIEAMLARNVNIRSLRDRLGRTPCHVASSHSDIAAVLRMLVDVVGISIDAVDDHGCPPTHVAVLRANENVLRVLIELGADVDKRDSFAGNTALHRLCGHNDQFEHFDPCLTFLLAAGADPCVVNDIGETPCHVAARLQRYDALCAFAALQVDMDQADRSGKTPRSLMGQQQWPTASHVEEARRRIVGTRLDFVRKRASEICIALQSLDLDALQLCEIMSHSCGSFANCVPFHHWWKLATTVKHFKRNQPTLT